MRNLLIIALLTGCTPNQFAKSYGGTMSVDLECGQKLFDLTWKGDSFWYATRPMRSDEKAETYTFREQSSFGVMEGKVVIRECVQK